MSMKSVRMLFSALIAVSLVTACAKKKDDPNVVKMSKVTKAELDAKVAQADENLKKAEESIAKAEAIQKEADKLKEEILAKQAQIESENLSLEAKRQEIAKLEESAEPLKAELLAQRQETEAAAEELRKAQVSVDEAQAKLADERKAAQEEYAKNDADITSKNEALKAREDAVSVREDQAQDREAKIAANEERIKELDKRFADTLRKTVNLLASKFAKDVFQAFLNGSTVPAFIGYSTQPIPKKDAVALRERIKALNKTKKYILKQKMIPNEIAIDAILPLEGKVQTAGNEGKIQVNSTEKVALTDTFLVEASKEDLLAIRDALRTDPRVNLVVVEPILRLSVDRRLVVRDRDAKILKDVLVGRDFVQNIDFTTINIDLPSTYIGKASQDICKKMDNACMNEIVKSGVLDKTPVQVSYKVQGREYRSQKSMRDYLQIALTNTVSILDAIIAKKGTGDVLGGGFSLARKTISKRVVELGEAMVDVFRQQDIENQNFVGYVDMTYTVALYRDRAKDDLPVGAIYNRSKAQNTDGLFIDQDMVSTTYILPVKNRDTSSLQKPDSFADHRESIIDVLNAVK